MAELTDDDHDTQEDYEVRKSEYELDTLRADNDRLTRERDEARMHVGILTQERDEARVKSESRCEMQGEIDITDGRLVACNYLVNLQYELHTVETFLTMQGYKKCDLPACNCGSWHKSTYDTYDQMEVDLARSADCAAVCAATWTTGECSRFRDRVSVNWPQWDAPEGVTHELG